jgi:hypothetical protein
MTEFRQFVSSLTDLAPIARVRLASESLRVDKSSALDLAQLAFADARRASDDSMQLLSRALLISIESDWRESIDWSHTVDVFIRDRHNVVRAICAASLDPDQYPLAAKICRELLSVVDRELVEDFLIHSPLDAANDLYGG